MTVTIAIKAYNEQEHIAAALESALLVSERLSGRVVLADSASTDATVDIASGYPVKILQMTDGDRRSCGAAAQLAFQGVDTPYFYLMDGDMRLDETFIAEAVEWLDAHPDCAGVGGAVVETLLANPEFKIRNKAMSHEHHRRAGLVDRLDGGGLYRTNAIREAGYFAHQALKSYEEFDLAARLQARGWSLARLPVRAVEHTGHKKSGFAMLRFRFSSGQMGGAGAVLRAALGEPHLGFVLKHLKQLRVFLTILVWWVALPVALLTAGPFFALAMLLAPLVFLAFRRRSFQLGAYSFAYWNLCTLASLRSLMTRQPRPHSVAFREIKSTPIASGSVRKSH